MCSAPSGQVQAHIDAPPQKVWALLADLEQMGRWSPECYRIRGSTGQLPRALFGHYDTDHDGLLSVAEFAPLAESLPELGSKD